MAILWCREKYGNEASRDRTTGRYTRKFLVRVSDPQRDREMTILNSDPVKRYLFANHWEAGHDLDPTVTVSGFRLAQQEQHPELYELEINYESPDAESDDLPIGGGGGQQPGPTDPTLDPPEYEYTWASTKRMLTSADIVYSVEPHLVDNDSNRTTGITNTAGEPLENQPEIDDDRLCLTVSVNQHGFSVRDALEYGNTVNEKQFSGAEPRTVLMKPWRARRLFRAGVWYWRVTYEFHYRQEGWDIQLLNQGSYHLLPGEGGQKHLKDANGKLVKQPFTDSAGYPRLGLLDFRGYDLPDYARELTITVRPYRVKDWTRLSLPIEPPGLT